MRYIFVFLFALTGCSVKAQKNQLRKQKLIITGGVGYDLGLNTIHLHNITDHLNSINSNGISLPQVSVKWFIKNNWGVEALFNGILFNVKNNERKAFEKALEEKWGTQYYISKQAHYFNTAIDMNSISGALGINYKIERNRIAFIPRFLFGVVTVGQASAYYRLKEKNSNVVMDIHYSPGRYGGRDQFLWGPAFSFLYRLNSFKGISLNASWLMHKAGLDGTEMLTNRITNETIMQHYGTGKLAHRINVGIGFSFSVGRKNDLVKH